MFKILTILTKIILLISPNTYFESDINGDGLKERGVVVENQFILYSDSKEIFKTAEEYDVYEIMAGDVLGDLNEEILVFLWKKGNYGNSTPFWVKENDDSYKMHLFVYEIDQKLDNEINSMPNKEIKFLEKAKNAEASPLQVSPVWQSSNLPYKNIKTWLIDIDSNGKKDLIPLQRSYKNGKINLGFWTWSSWGFVNMLD